MINSRNESQIPKALNTFFPQKHSFYSPYSFILFSHLADAFIQSDLQMRTTEAINWSIKTTKNRSKTKS